VGGHPIKIVVTGDIAIAVGLGNAERSPAAAAPTHLGGKPLTAPTHIGNVTVPDGTRTPTATWSHTIPPDCSETTFQNSLGAQCVAASYRSEIPAHYAAHSLPQLAVCAFWRGSKDLSLLGKGSIPLLYGAHQEELESSVSVSVKQRAACVYTGSHLLHKGRSGWLR
jgi:hypothetical protein